MSSEFFPLSTDQIRRLKSRGCSSSDWSKVQAAEGFAPESAESVFFSGDVKLGVFDKKLTLPGGVVKAAGLSNARIHNCVVGNNAYINHISNCIANYVIEDEAVIENVDLLSVEGESSFGNGVDVCVINEARGREVPIYDHLSAQTAYIIALYRHRPKVIEHLRKMIAAYASSVSSSMGLVAKGARLTNCRIIRNVKIGPAAVVEGVNKLENGSINSSPQAPSYFGPGVFAEDFVCCTGSTVSDGAMISKCFAGQGTVLARQYSAENCLFFANCEALQGEACSVFAGPYTVTHHKSTLLIAGMFSFFNAGSGSNQSNHLYKLGPVHQGIVERGVKTGSDSYILWPARIGAFSVVVGRHYERADTSDFPFSYLIERGGQSILVPGTNLRKAGLARDFRKWPARDKRKDSDKHDLINFELLSPYTVQRIFTAYQMLTDFMSADDSSDCFVCPGAKIEKPAIETAVKLYKLAMDKFMGDCLVNRLENKQLNTADELRAVLSPDNGPGSGRWVDLAGLLAPDEIVGKTLADIESGGICTLEQLADAFRSMYSNYAEYQWTWAVNLLQQMSGKNLEALSAADVIELLTRAKAAVEKLGRMVYADARKDFSPVVQVGFGIDGDEATRQADFEAVRGTFEMNSFAREFEQGLTAATKHADELIAVIKDLH